ncbi:Rare lipoprotein A Flags: Precursor [Stenotrophomonas terrae]|uniref:Endolytic peptidoglycan transglycosylase RlpA n=1 Tax=Stenotrophomonas terrae TaxID=405446 RepID=A0A0R0CEA2_9GAMM|nr:septal ring lytic transglycosylase RlpA family protein [Stenotrophomonas terrae]KRG64148.1 Rare lipoprotein A Flags: Precursor [Stenotrophomonas terrae]
MNTKWLVPALIVLGLAACSSAPKKTASANGGGTSPRPTTVVQGHGGGRGECPEGSPYAKAQEDLSTRGNYTAGGLYKPGVNDTTPDYVPNVNCIPEPLVTNEPRSAVGNKSPYTVLGKQYQVMDRVDRYVEQGTASYYGQKFHGRLTSNREVYDMYAFTAAHKTLPLPSFARVTNLDNGESVIVRVNDRGPFHEGRVIDLSYAAAVRLGITQRGTGRVEVHGLTPGSENLQASADSRRGRRERAAATVAAAAPAARVTPSRMDQLVEKLPAAPARPVASNADHFETWMKDNGVRVATGRPATTTAAGPAPAPVSVQALPAASELLQFTPPTASAAGAAARAAAGPPPKTVPADPAARALGSILLQVASFSSRDNAARALGQLSSAGIVGASLSDIVSGGRTLWRLRVPASDSSSASELAGRIAGLGFGLPQVVRD